jgi:hypothetical protein
MGHILCSSDSFVLMSVLCHLLNGQGYSFGALDELE